jgi:hypothetical protein
MYSKADFINWLKRLPPATKLGRGPHACPIAEFTGKSAFLPSGDHPAWAVEFMNRYDGYPSPSVTDALALARSVIYTRDDFVDWLKSLPPETTFCQGFRSLTCPIAIFSGDYAPSSDGLPAWAETFIARYDEDLSTSLEAALQIAETL